MTITHNASDGEFGSWLVTGVGMAIDADGSPYAYHPEKGKGLDYLPNAGHPGNWYGLACDDHGHPYIQGSNAPAFDDSSRGFYVSTTTYERREFAHNDPRRYLNSETERFIVVPASFRKSVAGIVMGCKAIVRFDGKECTAIVGDIGPRFGEASIAVARALGINSNAKSGGVDHGVEYQVFPGVAVDGYELQRA